MVFMRSILGYIAAAFCVVVWGGTFVNTSGLLEDFSSLEIMIGRFGLAWVALWILTRRKLVRHKPSDEWLFVGMGVTGASIYQLLENCAIYYTDATNLTSMVFTGDMPTLLSLLGAACIVIGVSFANFKRREI